jgi:rhodanese-related sulfurtransferase
LRQDSLKGLRLSAARRFAATLRASSLRLDAGAARELLDHGALLIDVRRRDDPSDPLDGAVRIAPDEVPARLSELPHDTPIVLVCT